LPLNVVLNEFAYANHCLHPTKCQIQIISGKCI
jgi:hypothetical protein